MAVKTLDGTVCYIAIHVYTPGIRLNASTSSHDNVTKRCKRQPNICLKDPDVIFFFWNPKQVNDITYLLKSLMITNFLLFIEVLYGQCMTKQEKKKEIAL